MAVTFESSSHLEHYHAGSNELYDLVNKLYTISPKRTDAIGNLEAGIREISGRHLDSYKRLSGSITDQYSGIDTLKPEFLDLSQSNRFAWNITNYAEKEKKMMSGLKVMSPTFTSSEYGYRFQCWIFITTGGYLGVGVKLVPGQSDNIVSWPFRKTITIKLVNRVEPLGHKKFVVRPFPEDPSGLDNGLWICPMKGDTRPGVTGWICDLEELRGKSTFASDFLRDGEIYLEVETSD